MAENNCGSFEFKGKKYKAILMVKTLIRKIQKKESSKLWTANKEYIRPYRILLKEVLQIQE